MEDGEEGGREGGRGEEGERKGKRERGRGEKGKEGERKEKGKEERGEKEQLHKSSKSIYRLIYEPQKISTSKFQSHITGSRVHKNGRLE